MRQTQIDSYHSLENKETKQQAVLEVIRRFNGISNREISKHLNWPINRVTGRVSELVERGSVYESGKELDKETNRTVILWKETTISKLRHEMNKGKQQNLEL